MNVSRPVPALRGAATISPDDSWLLTAADVLRVAALASLAWAVLRSEWVNAALFALVVGGLVLPRLLATRPALDLASGAVVLFAAWSAVLDLYVSYDWLDVVVHAVACGLVTVTVLRLLVTASVLPAPGGPGVRRPRTGVVVTTLVVGLALGALWEAGEWLGHTYLDERIQVGYDDTMGDLAADGLGALVTGLVLGRVQRRLSR
ncbi:MAG TPA: hypothetical protein VER39_13655 [Nocardioidaceae bacterium]|nr:hypothetical protein [Nocardioidaceae bacterium]